MESSQKTADLPREQIGSNGSAELDFLYDYHREAYYYQLERIDKIRERTLALSGLLTLITGGMLYIIYNFPYASPGSNAAFDVSAVDIMIVYVPMGVAFVTAFIAWFFVILALLPERYAYIATAQQIEDWVRALRKKAVERGRSDVLAKIKFKLATDFAKAATANFEVNRGRNDRFFWSLRFSIAAATMLTFCLPGFFFKSKSQNAAESQGLRTEQKKGNQ